jgi:hypothetical protein
LKPEGKLNQPLSRLVFFGQTLLSGSKGSTPSAGVLRAFSICLSFSAAIYRQHTVADVGVAGILSASEPGFGHRGAEVDIPGNRDTLVA